MKFDLDLFLKLNQEWSAHPLTTQPPATNPDGLARAARRRAANLDRRFGVEGKRVLEIGCGRGYLTRLLSDEYGCDAVGLDIRSYDVWDGRCIEGDIADPPDLDTFDLVVSYAVWEHIEHPYAALKNKRELLRPGGLAFMIANLYRGPKASHRYRQVFFPWPHLLFTDHVFEEFYAHIGKPPMRAAWVNRLIYLHYLDYFRRVGFGVKRVWTSEPWWNEPFYRRFEDVLGRYPRWDLAHDFINAVLARDKDASDRDSLIKQLERRVREQERRLEMMHSSTSWRVTAPLRAAGRLRRRLLG